MTDGVDISQLLPNAHRMKREQKLQAAQAARRQAEEELAAAQAAEVPVENPFETQVVVIEELEQREKALAPREEAAPERPNPFAGIALSDEETLDETERRIFADGRRKALDFGSFRPETFRRAIAAVELEYRRLGRIPTISEVADSWPHIEKRTYGELYAHRGFRDALNDLGIRIQAGEGLSNDQLSALAIICDPTDKRNTGAKMRSLGLTYQTYQLWMRDPVFKEERSRRAREVLEDVVPVAHERLATNVENGDQRAIEFLFAAKGIYSAQNAAQQDAMQVVYAVLEAVQKHVTDKHVLTAILDDVRSAGLAFDLTHRPGML